jgi:hypothetical protein
MQLNDIQYDTSTECINRCTGIKILNIRTRIKCGKVKNFRDHVTVPFHKNISISLINFLT